MKGFKEFIWLKGTKGTSYWYIDPKKNLAMPIVKYYGCFHGKDGSEFTLTEKTDEVFCVTTQNNRVTSVCFKVGESNVPEKDFVLFEGKMALAIQVDNSYSHYKIVFAELDADKESSSLLFDSCGYNANELPFEQVYDSLQMFSGSSVTLLGENEDEGPNALHNKVAAT